MYGIGFSKMYNEWLEFIVQCRSGKIHEYDIVEGPMADDTIWNFVNDYLDGNISKEVFWNMQSLSIQYIKLVFTVFGYWDAWNMKGVR